MAQIRVAIIDPTKTKKTMVALPDDVPMNRLIPALVGKLNLPARQMGNRQGGPRVNRPDGEESLGQGCLGLSRWSGSSIQRPSAPGFHGRASRLEAGCPVRPRALDLSSVSCPMDSPSWVVGARG